MATMLSAAPRRRFSSATFALFVVLGLSGCDDKPKGEPGKAQSEPGKQLENAKQKIHGAEQQLQERDDRVYEAAQDEKVERGI